MKAARLFLPLFAFVLLWGCDPQNTAKVGCQDPDCKASCLAKGFAEGACQASGCVCTPWDTASYKWPDESTAPTGSDETDSGSGDTSSNTETVEPTDSSAGSDSESESASGSESDSGSDSATDSSTPDSDTPSSSSDDTGSV